MKAKEYTIHILAPFLAECEPCIEKDRVEMCLIWDVNAEDYGYIWNTVTCAEAGLYSPHGLICHLHDYLKTKHYF